MATTAKLNLYCNGKYRNSSKVEMPSEDTVEDVKKAIKFLQRFFDISVQFEYTSPNRETAPTYDTRPQNSKRK